MWDQTNSLTILYSILHILLPALALGLAVRLSLCPVVHHPSVAAAHAAVDHAAVGHAHAAAAVVVTRDGGATCVSGDGAMKWRVTYRDDFRACCVTASRPQTSQSSTSRMRRARA